MAAVAPALLVVQATMAFLGAQAAYFVVGLLALLGIGAISHHLVERPFLDLKRYFVAGVTRRAV